VSLHDWGLVLSGAAIGAYLMALVVFVQRMKDHTKAIESSTEQIKANTPTV
jgi:hypothetical protein